MDFAPNRTAGGKSLWSMERANALLANGRSVALATSKGYFVVPEGYRIAQTVVGDCFSLRTPEGQLVRYRMKRGPR